MIKSKYILSLLEKTKKNIKTIVLPEGEDERVLTAAHIISEAKAAKIVILGSTEKMSNFFAEKGWNTDGIEFIEPEKSPRLAEYTELLYNLRKEKQASFCNSKTDYPSCQRRRMFIFYAGWFYIPCKYPHRIQCSQLGSRFSRPDHEAPFYRRQ